MQTYDRDIVFNKIMRVLNALLKAIVIVIFIFPFYWMVSTSLKDLTEALQFPPTLIPKKIQGGSHCKVLYQFRNRQPDGAGAAVSGYRTGGLQPFPPRVPRKKALFRSGAFRTDDSSADYVPAGVLHVQPGKAFGNAASPDSALYLQSLRNLHAAPVFHADSPGGNRGGQAG